MSDNSTPRGALEGIRGRPKTKTQEEVLRRAGMLRRTLAKGLGCPRGEFRHGGRFVGRRRPGDVGVLVLLHAFSRNDLADRDQQGGGDA